MIAIKTKAVNSGVFRKAMGIPPVGKLSMGDLMEATAKKEKPKPAASAMPQAGGKGKGC